MVECSRLGISDWRTVDEPRFPPAPEPKDEQARSGLELEPPNIMAQTLWPDNVPFGYPFRRMEFDEGVTYVKTGRAGKAVQGILDGPDSTLWAVLAGIAIICICHCKHTPLELFNLGGAYNRHVICELLQLLLPDTFEPGTRMILQLNTSTAKGALASFAVDHTELLMTAEALHYSYRGSFT